MKILKKISKKKAKFHMNMLIKLPNKKLFNKKIYYCKKDKIFKIKF
jgi:hypothetical protein